MANKPKRIIAVDIDDVLSLHAEAFVEYSNRTFHTKFNVDDYDEHWADLWGIDNEELERRVQAYHDSGVMEAYQPRDGAISVLKRLTLDYSLIVITSRKTAMTEITTAWLTRHYPDIFSSVHHAGMWDIVDESSVHATKAKLSKELGASFIIDDQLKHCVESAEIGIKALLFGDYKWNHTDSLPLGVTRCKDWAEVEEYFYGSK